MKVELLAFDSMGVRSMASFIKTKDVAITIDPGVSLGPLRYGLEPHPLEYKEEIKRWNLIEKKARDSDILIISHYHYDHYNPDKPDLYSNKIVFIKDPKNKINQSQKRRASSFIPQIEPLVKSLDIADGRDFKFGSTRISFSPPVFHGKNARLGYVVQTLIDDGKKRIIHTSDIEGPCNEIQIDFILRNKPNIVIMDGPLTYMLGYRMSYDDLNKAKNLLKKVLAMKSLEVLVYDHHFMRDLKWEERIADLFKYAKEHNSKIMPASRFMGEKLNILEARRKELWEQEI